MLNFTLSEIRETPTCRVIRDFISSNRVNFQSYANSVLRKKIVLPSTFTYFIRPSRHIIFIQYCVRNQSCVTKFACL